MREEKSKSGKVKVRNKALFIGIIGIVAIVLAVAAIGANANISTEASDKVNVPDVPHKINYQGYLTDADGNPITSDRDMTFGIYDSHTGGTPLWSETQSSVHVEKGLFNVILGSVNPIPGDVFPSGGSRWLETAIEGQTLTPRKEIVSVAYAFKANQDDDWDYTTNQPHMYSIPPGNVGIGTESPQAKLDIKGNERCYCSDQTNPNHEDSYIQFEPNLCGYCNGVAITLNEYRNRNKLWISAYNEHYGNLVYTEDPQGNSGQGFGIAGGSHMAPFPRFVVNANETFLGYSIYPGIGGPCGVNGTGNLYVRGKVGIGTTDPQTDLHVAASPEQSVRINGVGRITIHAPTGMTAAYLAAIDGINTWGMGKTLTTDNDFHIYNYPSSRTDLTILDSNGNVGIGTTTPQGPLQVGEGSFIVTPENKVGIGTLVPKFNLDVTSPTGAYIRVNKPSPDRPCGFVLATDDINKWYIFMPTGAPNQEDLWFYSSVGPGIVPEMMIQRGTGNVGINTFSPKEKLHVVGNVLVQGRFQVIGPKQFVQAHPTDPTKEIVYVSLEGPEAGTYIRGTAQLVNGEAVINLPEHFSLVTSDEGLTVQLTPAGEWLQLYVVEKGTQRIIIHEANDKNGQFDYLVQGVRKGYENHQVIGDKE